MSLDYTVVLRSFADTTNFGLGNTAVIIENPHYLAWTEYSNDVAEAFFTISQEDPKAVAIQSLIDIRGHMEVYRGGEKVWGGWLGESDENGTDVIVYAYNYNSGLYDLLTDWNQIWTGQQVDTIITNLWDRARTGLTGSRVRWMTTGTIETPVTTSGGGTPLVLPFYRAYFKRILDGMKELTAYAISDTTNKVNFEITPAGVFNLWKNRGSSMTDIRWRLGDGKVRSFRRLRVPVDRRSKVYGVGSSPLDLTLRDTETNATLVSSMGLSEEPVYMTWVRDATELARVTKLRLQRAGRVDTDLFVSFYGGVITPFRATGADYNLLDTATFQINKGMSVVAEDKIIVGQQVIFYRNVENVRVLLADRL